MSRSGESGGSKSTAGTTFFVICLVALVVFMIVAGVAPSTGILGYVGMLALSLGIALVGVFFLLMLIFGIAESHVEKNSSDAGSPQHDQAASTQPPAAAKAKTTKAGAGGEASGEVSPVKGCLWVVFLGAISLGCILGGLVMGHAAILDVPYLADPSAAYLENAHCTVEHTTDSDGDPVTNYYLQGIDETGKHYSFPIDEDMFGEISGKYVRVRYLPNTNILLEVEQK